MAGLNISALRAPEVKNCISETAQVATPEPPKDRARAGADLSGERDSQNDTRAPARERRSEYCVSGCDEIHHPVPFSVRAKIGCPPYGGIGGSYSAGMWAGAAFKRRPSADMTFNTVANSGFPLPLSAR